MKQISKLALAALAGLGIIGLTGCVPTKVLKDNTVKAKAKTSEHDGTRKALEKESKRGQVALTEANNCLTVGIDECVLFAPGDEKLALGGQQILKKLAQSLAKGSGKIRVVGHTDSTPIAKSKWTSNWELSTARATMVAKFMMEHGKLEPKRFEIVGRGEFSPVAQGKSASALARNRRIEVVVSGSNVF